MNNKPLFIAFSTQKGGVGKTTFTVLASSLLYYLKGYNVAIVDCDYPQYSINAMRMRDAEQVNREDYLKVQLVKQFNKMTQKKAYPILTSSPETAINTAEEFLDSQEENYDLVFFDLPGTVDSPGIISSLSNLDYIFTPITADRVVLESSLSFAAIITDSLVINPAFRLNGLYLFWNMVDGREKTDLYEDYEKTIKELNLPLMQTFIPNAVKYRKEISGKRQAIFRSTLFPADNRLVKDSNLHELIAELVHIIKL